MIDLLKMQQIQQTQVLNNSALSPFDLQNTGKRNLGNAIDFIQKSKKKKNNASTVAANDEEQEDISLRKRNDYTIDNLGNKSK